MNKLILSPGDYVLVKANRKMGFLPQEWRGQVEGKRIARDHNGTTVYLDVGSRSDHYRGRATFLGDLLSVGDFRDWRIEKKLGDE